MAEIVMGGRTGAVVLVDDADFAELSRFNWFPVVGGKYAARNSPSGSIYMHRELLPGAPEVDHISGDGLDNRRANLRSATRTGNVRNRRKMVAYRDGTPTTSRFRGVTWNRNARKWLAQIQGDDGHAYLGIFVDETEAARAYDAAARKLHGEFARLNFAGA